MIPGSEVMKVGRSTLTTFGFVMDDKVTAYHDHNEEESLEVSVLSTTAGYAFSYMSDSGGPVIDQHGAWVGIVSAGGVSKVDSNRTELCVYVTPMQVVVADMKARFGLVPELHRPQDTTTAEM